MCSWRKTKQGKEGEFLADPRGQTGTVCWLVVMGVRILKDVGKLNEPHLFRILHVLSPFLAKCECVGFDDEVYVGDNEDEATDGNEAVGYYISYSIHFLILVDI